MAPKFTAKHYRAVAEILDDIRTQALDDGDLFTLSTLEGFAHKIADRFRTDNPRFDRQRFIRAAIAGLTTSTPKE